MARGGLPLVAWESKQKRGWRTAWVSAAFALACVWLLVSRADLNASAGSRTEQLQQSSKPFVGQTEELSMVLKPEWYLTSQRLEDLSQDVALAATSCFKDGRGRPLEEEIHKCAEQVCAIQKPDVNGIVPNIDPRLLGDVSSMSCCEKQLLFKNRTATCQVYGCFPAELKTSQSDIVASCKRWFCEQPTPVSSLDQYAKALKTPEFADAEKRGYAACCHGVLSYWKDSLPRDFCKADSHAVMDAEACQQYLCKQDPPIQDIGASLQLWKHAHENKADDTIDTCVSTIKVSGTAQWHATCEPPGAEEAPEMEAIESKQMLEDMVGRRLTADDVKKIEAIENPNANPLVPVEAAPNDCSSGAPSLNPLPGTDILGRGYDPALKPGCKYDTCASRTIMKWTYGQCKAMHSPAGTFSVPDQIKVSNLYSVNARTHVYMTQKEESDALAMDAGVSGGGNYGAAAFSAAASFGMSKSGASDSNSHVAIRSIHVDLYSLQMVPPTSWDGLSPDFVAHFNSLPTMFSQAPHRWLGFVKTWGRFISVGGNWGGSLDIKMKFESSSTADSRDIAAGVEAAFDGMFSAKAHFNMDISKASKELSSSAEISLSASGGDPQIAAVITDLAPGSETTARFRDDFAFWLKSVPSFPRIAQPVPRLEPLTRFLPVDGTVKTEMKTRALNRAINVFSQDPAAAMHSSSQTCSVKPGQDSSPRFTDFNVFQQGQCLAFSANSNSGIKIVLAGNPTDKESWYLFDITPKGVLLFKADSSEPVAHTMNPAAFAVNDASLAADYWVCLVPQEHGASVEYGKGSTTFLKYEDEDSLRPSFFGLSCESFANFKDIGVYPASQWKEFTTEDNSCNIAKCEHGSSKTVNGKCICTHCKPSFKVVDGGSRCARTGSCPQKVGCVDLDSRTCDCKKCCCGLALHPVTKACIENGAWTDNYGAASVEFTGILGSSFGKTTRMAIAADEYYRIKNLKMKCSENEGLQGIDVKHIKITNKPPVYMPEDTLMQWGSLVGDDSYGQDNVLLQAWLDERPGIKSLIKKARSFAQGIADKVKNIVTFGRKIDIYKVSEIFEKGLEKVRNKLRREDKKAGVQPALPPSNCTDCAVGSPEETKKFANEWLKAGRDVNVDGLLQGANIAGMAAKGMLGSVEMIDWAMNESPLGNVLTCIPGVGTAVSVIQMVSKYIPTDIAKVAIDAATGQDVPINEILEAGLSAFKLDIDIPNLGSVNVHKVVGKVGGLLNNVAGNLLGGAGGGGGRRLLEDFSSDPYLQSLLEASEENPHLEALLSLVEAHQAFHENFPSGKLAIVGGREKDFHKLTREGQMRSLAWKTTLSMYHDHILHAFRQANQLTPMQQREMSLLLKDIVGKVSKHVVNKVLANDNVNDKMTKIMNTVKDGKIVGAMEKVGNAVLNTLEIVNPDLANDIRSSYTGLKDALFSGDGDFRSLAKMLMGLNFGEVGLLPDLQEFTTTPTEKQKYFTPTAIYFQCRDSSNDDSESSLVDVAVKYKTGESSDSMTETVYTSASMMDQVVSAETIQDFSYKLELAEGEYIVAVAVSRTKHGVKSITGVKTNKRFETVSCGSESSSEPVYSFCSTGNGFIGFYGARNSPSNSDSSRSGIRSIGVECAGSSGSWQTLEPVDPFFYPSAQDIMMSTNTWPSILLTDEGKTECKTETVTVRWNRKKDNSNCNNRQERKGNCYDKTESKEVCTTTPDGMDGWKSEPSSPKLNGQGKLDKQVLSTTAGTFSETQFMQSEKFKITSMQFYCTTEWVSAAHVGYTDGTRSWTEFVGGGDQTQKATEVVEFESDETPQGLLVADDERFTQSIRGIVTDKRTVEIHGCGNGKATPKYKSCTAKNNPNAYFKAGMAGLYGFVEFKKDQQRFRQLGLLCAKESSKDSLVQPSQKGPFDFEEGEYLTGFVGIMTAVTENTNKLGGIAAITTNNKVIPTQCGSEIGPRESVAIPMDGMPISLFAKDDGDGSLSGLGIQYVKVPTVADNGFIVHELAKMQETNSVGKHVGGGEAADMKKSFFPFYTNTYLRLVELQFQCVYDGHFSYLSFMSAVFSNKDKFEFGFKLNSATNVFDRTIDLSPNENLETLDFFTNKQGLLTGIAGATTSDSDKYLNCGHGTEQVSVVAAKGYHIVGLAGEVIRSKTKSKDGVITKISAITVPK